MERVGLPFWPHYPERMATIGIHVGTDGTFRYEWKGPKDAPFGVTDELQEDMPSFIANLPWPVHPIARGAKATWYMRDDADG